MSLSNVAAWNDKKAASACGSACGASGEPKKEAPSACGASGEPKKETPSACGASDEPKKETPSACGSACGASDK